LEFAIASSATNSIIRACEITDLPAVLRVEKASYPHPWSEDHFLQELASSYSHIDLLCLHGQLAGYICFWLAAGELQILNVVTSFDFRRTGVAYSLLNHAFLQAKELNIESAYLEVRAGNKEAIALYRKFGFEDASVRRAYYSDGEDALLMICRLKNHLLNGV